MFSQLETANILTAKMKLGQALEDFNLTLKKLNTSGVDFVQSYYVTGGCIGSLLRAEEPNDYDIYFVTDSYCQRVARLFKEDPSYMHMVAEFDIKYRELKGLDGRMITENATTLKNKLQIITMHTGFPEAIRKTFDFIHCMPYYVPCQDKLYISREQYDLNMDKRLKVNNKETFTAERTKKFVDRGWKPDWDEAWTV